MLARLVETLIPFVTSSEIKELYKMIEFVDLWALEKDSLSFEFQVEERCGGTVFHLQFHSVSRDIEISLKD